jgi:cell wall-associated NlpC family hydrolase
MTMRLRLIALCLLLLLFPTLAFAAKTHKIKKKESLTSLSRKYHVTVAELKSANNLVNNHLKPGDVLVIPPRADAGSSDAAPARKDTVYRVQKGDTLGGVARKTGITMAELKRLNDLHGKKPRLKPGQVLALKANEPAKEPRVRTARLSSILRNSEQFADDEFERSLDDLSAADPSKPVDLAKSIEMGSNGDQIAALKKTAYSFLGARYRFGGTSRNSLDCSSFVQQVFRDMSVNLPRTAREQFSVGDMVSPSNLQKGDLVFFHTYARFPSHVGIYLGGNKMIHASSRDRRVVISSFNTPYYTSRFIGAKRIAKINPDIFNFSDLLLVAEEEREDDVLNNDTLGVGAD